PAVSSFPTRRSSDLEAGRRQTDGAVAATDVEHPRAGRKIHHSDQRPAAFVHPVPRKHAGVRHKQERKSPEFGLKPPPVFGGSRRSEEHTSELQSREN